MSAVIHNCLRSCTMLWYQDHNLSVFPAICSWIRCISDQGHWTSVRKKDLEHIHLCEACKKTEVLALRRRENAQLHKENVCFKHYFSCLGSVCVVYCWDLSHLHTRHTVQVVKDVFQLLYLASEAVEWSPCRSAKNCSSLSVQLRLQNRVNLHSPPC